MCKKSPNTRVVFENLSILTKERTFAYITDMYTYYDLQVDIRHLRSMGAHILTIGNTVLGTPIPCVHIGNYSPNQILIQGSVHAREHITSKLIIEQIYYIIARYGVNGIGGGIYFVPMVNIDGVELCEFGLDVIPQSRHEFLLQVNGGSSDFSLWKANINAVDINTNFPARWGTGAQNVTYPAPSDYIGPYAASEPETRALMAITRRVYPRITISYHSRGNEIYWEFYQPPANLERDRNIGLVLSELTTYTLIEGTRGSAGGYKDWCIQDFYIPAYTIEIVDSSYPYPIDYKALEEVWEQNKDVPITTLAEARKYFG